jgi:Multiubiquitin
MPQNAQRDDRVVIFKIDVNDQHFDVPGPNITFEQLVALVPVPGVEPSDYSIAYSRGKGGHRNGILEPGQSVELEHGMFFDVLPTRKS